MSKSTNIGRRVEKDIWASAQNGKKVAQIVGDVHISPLRNLSINKIGNFSFH